MAPVGSYTPVFGDDGEEVGAGRDRNGTKVRPGWSKARTNLEKAAIEVTRHQKNGEDGYFSSKEQAKRFRALEEKTRGAGDEDYIFRAWMMHIIENARTSNRLRIERSMDNIIVQMENETRRTDWVANNRKRVLTLRAQVAKDAVSAFIKEAPDVDAG